MATSREVTESISRILKKCAGLLNTKGKEYAGSDRDRLLNFKIGQKFMVNKGAYSKNKYPYQILWGYLVKHLVSISYMCHMVQAKPSREDWDEKICDAINYLLLLSAMVDEDIGDEFDKGKPARKDSKSTYARQSVKRGEAEGSLTYRGEPIAKDITDLMGVDEVPVEEHRLAITKIREAEREEKKEAALDEKYRSCSIRYGKCTQAEDFDCTRCPNFTTGPEHKKRGRPKGSANTRQRLTTE